MTTTTNRSTREQNYHRALEASHEVAALDRMVRLIAELGPPKGDDPMRYACVWESALKLLAFLVVGRERGRGVKSATSKTETWLRGQEAFDAVTDVWLKLLEDATRPAVIRADEIAFFEPKETKS